MDQVPVPWSILHRPTGKNFYAVAEGRRLEISPWAYEYHRREMCMVMNELVRMIARRADDWWKD